MLFLPFFFHVKGIIYRNMFGIRLKIIATDQAQPDQPDSNNSSGILMHKRITITLVWLIIVFIAMFGVYRFEKPKKFKLPLLRGEVVGAAPDFSAIHDIAERKEAFLTT